MPIFNHLIKKEFIQFRRTRAMIAIAFGMPIIQLLILGFAISGDVTNVPTAIFDKDNSVMSRSMVRKISSTDYLAVKPVRAGKDNAGDILGREKAIVAVSIPENFERDLKRGTNPSIGILADAQNSNIALTAASYARSIIISWAAESGLSSKTPNIANINVKSIIWYNPELKTINYMVPGIIVLLVTIVTIMLTALAIVKEREAGTLEQLLVTPINKADMIIGKTIPFGILGIMETCLALAVSVLVYRIHIAGSIGLFLFVSVLYIFCTMGVGILISTITHTQQQALFLAWFFMIFFLLMSGFMLPLENMPKAIYYLTYLDPLRFHVTVVRGIFLKNSGFTDLIFEISAIAFWAVFYLTVAIMRFQKRIG